MTRNWRRPWDAQALFSRPYGLTTSTRYLAGRDSEQGFRNRPTVGGVPNGNRTTQQLPQTYTRHSFVAGQSSSTQHDRPPRHARVGFALVSQRIRYFGSAVLRPGFERHDGSNGLTRLPCYVSAGTTPSCRMKLRASSSPVSSTILPSTTRRMLIPIQLTVLPVGGMGPKEPFCVA